MEIFCLKHVSFQYPFGEKQVLDQIELQLHSGEFILLCGASGSGKTTLLRQLKPAVTPFGDQSGQILFHGSPISEMHPNEQAEAIGFVSQNPEDQIVTDKVWHELAFGLESIGMEAGEIRKRVAEISQFFGIQKWFHQETASLSGGQKQLLNLASVMVMQPEILLLDEPTSQLDPIAASDFLKMLGRIHRELGTTILMTEHRLEEALPYCTRLLVMEEGRLCLDGEPAAAAEEIGRRQMSLFASMPTSVQVWFSAGHEDSPCPLTVREGKEWFADFQNRRQLFPLPEETNPFLPEETKKATVALKEVWFRYERKQEDILRGLSMQAYEGEVLAVMGGNGSGKTTALSVLGGSRKPQRGTVQFPSGKKRVICLPQNPQLLFTADTVREELEEMGKEKTAGFPDREEFQEILKQITGLCQLEELYERHPYDLSGGEQQRLALAKVLLARPEILLLDEPTKGLDVEYKQLEGRILQKLAAQGLTIIMVSHDIEFCAEYANRCILFFDGQVAASGSPRHFFSENHFYTTNANRMVRQWVPLAVTTKDVIAVCCGALERKQPEPEETQEKYVKQEECLPVQAPETLTQKAITEDSGEKRLQTLRNASVGLPMRTKLSLVIAMLQIPLTVLAGNNENYYLIAFLILLECMFPFFLNFEGRRPSVRELVILSVLCAIGVAGRAVFSMLPHFKPMTAITIIAGIAFGGEAGFLVGAVSILVSNMLFGQGPWTPWQMFALGYVGLFAGLLFYKKSSQNLFLYCGYGFLSTVILYGGVMNFSTVLLAGLPLTMETIGAFCLSGLPLDVLHGISTVLFLGLGAKPMLKKLERMRIKFG